MELWIWKAEFEIVDTGQTYSESSAGCFPSEADAKRDFEKRRKGTVPFRFAKSYVFLPCELTLKSVTYTPKR